MPVTLATNMKCQACLRKVQAVLDSSTSVVSWEADLGDERKLVHLTMAKGSEVDTAIALVNEAGFEATEVSAPSLQVLDERPGDDSQHDRSPAEKPFRISTYKPLFLVVGYVVGATILVEFGDGVWSWPSAMSYFMGFFFLGFAFFKLLDIGKFADAFASYDILANRSRAYAVAYPWLELGLGVLFVTKTWPLFANGLTALVMALGLVGVVSAVRKKQQIQCACLGTAFNLPMSSVTIIENSVMLLMALAMLAKSI